MEEMIMSIELFTENKSIIAKFKTNCKRDNVVIMVECLGEHNTAFIVRGRCIYLPCEGKVCMQSDR